MLIHNLVFVCQLWEVGHDEKGTPFAKYVASLNHHTTPVNVIRFSPAGDQLASGADGGELLIWKCVRTEAGGVPLSWKLSGSLRRHSRDVLDLEWSPDGSGLISGSVDNSSIVWDVSKGDLVHHFRDHLHYVQGVCWDPVGQYLVTQSGDRTCRVYGRQSQSNKNQKKKDKCAPAGGGPFTCQHVLLKRNITMLRGTNGLPPAVNGPSGGSGTMPSELQKEGCAANSKAVSTKHHLFYDENLPSFFRRLSFSPDGSFLAVPAGQYKHTLESSPVNTSYIFSRKDLSRPAFILPGHPKAVVVIRFCPVFFAPAPQSPSMAIAADNNRKGEPPKTFALPYRLVFAVATLDSLFLYDTQADQPIAVIAGLHYAPITDCAWAADGSMIAVSSQDGYCTMVTFTKGELGTPISLTDIPAHITDYLPQTVRERAAGGAATAAASTPGVQGAGDESMSRGKKRRRPVLCSPAKPTEHSSLPTAPQSPLCRVNDARISADPSTEASNTLAANVGKSQEDIKASSLADDAPKPKRRIFPVSVEKSAHGGTERVAPVQTEDVKKSETVQDSVAEQPPRPKRRIVPVMVTKPAEDECDHEVARSQGFGAAMEVGVGQSSRISGQDSRASGSEQKDVPTDIEPPKTKRRIVPMAVPVEKRAEAGEKRRIVPVAMSAEKPAGGGGKRLIVPVAMSAEKPAEAGGKRRIVPVAMSAEKPAEAGGKRRIVPIALSMENETEAVKTRRQPPQFLDLGKNGTGEESSEPLRTGDGSNSSLRSEKLLDSKAESTGEEKGKTECQTVPVQVGKLAESEAETEEQLQVIVEARERGGAQDMEEEARAIKSVSASKEEVAGCTGANTVECVRIIAEPAGNMPRTVVDYGCDAAQDLVSTEKSAVKEESAHPVVNPCPDCGASVSLGGAGVSQTLSDKAAAHEPSPGTLPVSTPPTEDDAMEICE
ncbi:hypothetical protein CBR_g20440 [Chara braunii]|uniref:CAF1B/HIR1 beta-propeller domain-containing protein n=1 Tax=Chara braunii TaxID=69332 RepID=A0A388JUC0_CHABU|nr:hypothetical protein CBR_g20440 [Chara braunii]|eukprot:GBG61409.1 hypothetical protein CBR_g20440 [Chara braunii]